MAAPVAVLAVLAVLVLAGAGGFVLFRILSRGRGGARPNALDWLPDVSLVDGHRPPEPEALSSQLLSLTRLSLDAEGAAVLKPEEEGWRVILTNPGLPVTRSVHKREGLLALAWGQERELVANSVHAEVLGYLSQRTGPVSLAIVPVGHRGHVRQLLACHRVSQKPFTDRDLMILKRCARILDGWETHAAEERVVHRRLDTQERLSRGLIRMLREPDPDPAELAGLALDALFDLLPATYGFAYLDSSTADYHAIQTKRFTAPGHFGPLDRGTWSYYVMTRSREAQYLDPAQSRSTAMPKLYAGEPFPHGSICFLHPLECLGEVFGVAGIVGKADDTFREDSRALASWFLNQVSTLIYVALLSHLNKENAMRDALTGLYNRRYFEERLGGEIGRTQRTGIPVSVVLFDLDHFKRVNDTYGHPVGDAALRNVAQRIRGAVRSVDVVCRYGGEEIAVILPACGPAEAADVAERSRRAVETMPCGPGMEIPERITVSAGVASHPSPFSTQSGLTKGADAALYEAKKKGRNRVELARR